QAKCLSVHPVPIRSWLASSLLLVGEVEELVKALADEVAGELSSFRGRCCITMCARGGDDATDVALVHPGVTAHAVRTLHHQLSTPKRWSWVTVSGDGDAFDDFKIARDCPSERGCPLQLREAPSEIEFLVGEPHSEPRVCWREIFSLAAPVPERLQFPAVGIVICLYDVTYGVWCEPDSIRFGVGVC